MKGRGASDEFFDHTRSRMLNRPSRDGHRRPQTTALRVYRCFLKSCRHRRLAHRACSERFLQRHSSCAASLLGLREPNQHSSADIPNREAESVGVRHIRCPSERRGRWKLSPQLSGIDGVLAAAEFMSGEATRLYRSVDGGLGDACGSGRAAWRVHGASDLLR